MSRQRGSAPLPREVRALARDLRSALGLLVEEYSWAHGVAYDRTVGNDVKVRAGAADPTGGLIASDHKGKTRHACHSAAEDLKDALAAIRHADDALRKALDRHDPREEPEPVRFPRTATRADLAESYLAKGRRASRGEGFGEA